MLPTQPRPVGVRLADVLATTFPPTADIFATSCASKADQVQPGDAYFAPPGEASYVLRHAQQAIEAGAKAVVVDQFLPIAGAPQFVVEDTQAAFGEFCHALLGHPSESLTTVAIGGGYGKSSTAHLLQTIFTAAGTSAVAAESDPTTPASYATWLAEAAANHHAVAIAKAPAQASRDGRFHGARFNAVCLTNLTGQPSKRRQSMASVHNELAAVTEDLVPGGVLVVNADDPPSCRLLAEWSGPAITYAANNPADLRARVIQRHSGGQVFLLSCGADSVAIETATIGEHHVQNCLAAAATAVALGVDLQSIAKGLESARPLPGCMQPVVCGQAFPVYLDAASQTHTIAAATAAAAAITTGRVLTVLGDNSDPQLLNAARSASDLVIGVSKRPSEHSSESDVRLVEDRFSAIALALALAEANDSVLIAGCEIDNDSSRADQRTIRELLVLRLANEPQLFPIAS